MYCDRNSGVRNGAVFSGFMMCTMFLFLFLFYGTLVYKLIKGTLTWWDMVQTERVLINEELQMV